MIKIFLFLAVLAFCADETLAIDNTAPGVLSTSPANGATGVAVDLETIVITFTEPMNGNTNYNYSPVWVNSTSGWSDDRTQLFISRSNAGTALDEGKVIQINLNPYGSSNYFEDLAGNRLPAYSFSFTIRQSNPLAPVVVSTSPSNGEADVSLTPSGCSITFNKPMQEMACTGFSTHGDEWGEATNSWSPDHRTLVITRNNPEIILREGAIFTITLDPEVCEDYYFMDQANGYKLGAYSFSFTAEINKPTVETTFPASQALLVSPDLETVSLTFSEEMADAVSFSEISKIWGSSSYEWSEDHRTIYITRDSAGTPLTEGALITFVFNPSGSMNFQDLDGNLLDTFTLSFKIAGVQPYQVSRIDADPEKGFFWPYYLTVPDVTTENTTLLVEPNNTGLVSDDISVHEASALDLLIWRSTFAVDMKVPLLVPVFPRPASMAYMYTHALDSATLSTSIPDYVRLDEQLIAMVQDARMRLSRMGYHMDRKFFMMGFSASGMFTSRFTAIHPEIVRAAAVGSPGGWPLAPVTVWQGIPMHYPVGILDLDELIGKSINLYSLRKVPQYIYVGDADRNDALDTREFPEGEKLEICDLLDCSPEPLISQRWPLSETIYNSIGIENDFVIYPDVAHTITTGMFQDIQAFFEAHRPQPVRMNPAIPLLLLDD